MAITETEVRKSHFSNIGFSVASWAFPLILAFLATPILIKYLGVSTYGVYTLVLAIIGFGFSTGVGRVTSKYIPEFRGGNDPENLEKYLNFAFFLTTATALLQGTLLALITPLLVDRVFQISDSSQELVRSALYLTCLIGPLMILSQYFQSSLQGLQQFRGLSIITNVASAILNLGAIILVVAGFGVISIIGLNLVVTVIAAISYFNLARRSLPEFRPRFSFDKDPAFVVLKYAGSIVIYQVMASTLFIFERGFVIRYYGAESLTYYVVPLMLGIYLHALLFSFSQAIFPALNEKLNDSVRLVDFYQKSTKLILAVALFIAAGYYSYGRSFLTLWLGQEFADRSYPILLIHGSAFAAIAISLVAWIAAEALRKPMINAFSSFISTGIALCTIMLLDSIYQLLGIASGRFVGALAVLPLIFYVEKRFFGKIFWRFWIESAGLIIFATLLMTLVSQLLLAEQASNWLLLVFNGIVGAIVFFGFLILTRYFPIKDVLSLITPKKI